MNIFEQLQQTLTHLDSTPDRPPLSLVACEGLGSRPQAWESATARRLRQAVESLRGGPADEYPGQIERIINPIQASARLLAQPELLKAAQDFPELVEDVEMAGVLCDELCQAARLLRSARDHGAACQALEIFMEIFHEFDPLEDRLLAQLAEVA